MTGLSDDLMAPEVIDDPHSYYRQLREVDPIHWNQKWGGWIITRYRDVVQVLRDAKRFSSDRMGYLARELSAEQREQYAPIFNVLSRWMVFSDPPFHTRLRLLLNPLFTPTSVEQYRPMVRNIVQKLIDKIERRGEMEVVRDFAYQVPMSVILELMGMPHLDRDRVKEWSEQLGVFFFIRADDPRRREIACQGVTALVDYLKPIVEERRSNPGNDLISILIKAQERGELTESDVIATCVLMVFGGHETTMNLIANGILALMRHPQEWERLRKQPAIVKLAVEELLRYDGPVKTTVRWVKEDVDLEGRALKEGDRVLVALSSANRDLMQFDNPDALNLRRDPNPHVAFGQGIHICLGAPLARMEAQEAVLGLTARLTCPTLESEELDYVPSVIHRALKALPVTFHPTARG